MRPGSAQARLVEIGDDSFVERCTIKSGDNKGTIRADMRYLLVSPDVRRHRLISRDYLRTLAVTAEAAGSSPVVPAIHSEELTGIALFSRGHKKAQNRHT